MTKNILQYFCSADDKSPVLEKPVLIGGRIIATDRRVMISIPPEKLEGYQVGEFVEPSAELSRRILKILAAPMGPKAFDMPVIPDCPSCRASGLSCCPICASTIVCPDCLGTKMDATTAPLDVGGRLLHTFYAVRLLLLPGPLRFFPPQPPSPAKPIPFTFGEGIGCVMSLRPEDIDCVMPWRPA